MTNATDDPNCPIVTVWLRIGAALVLGATLLVVGPGISLRESARATIQVDFTEALVQVSPERYGTGITGYGRGSNIALNTTHRTLLTQLGVGTMRIELAYTAPGDANSRLVCGGKGCDQSIDAAAWLNAIRQAGAEPIVILPMDGRRDAAADLVDAVRIYQELSGAGIPVRRFIVGNEPDHPTNPKRLGPVEYSRRFNQIADALHQIDPDTRVGGPALTYYNKMFIDAFLAMSGRRIDFIDFHKYGQGGSDHQRDQTLLGTTVRTYRDQIADLRRRIDAALPADRARQVGIQVGEFNLDWDGDPRLLTGFNAVWIAAVLGTILQAGATAIQYGDKNGQLGLTSEIGEGGIPRNQPLPAYHGYGMFTGEGLFRAFGTDLVRTHSNTPLLYVFASANPRNIVVVNATTTPIKAEITLKGVSDAKIQSWVLGQDVHTPKRDTVTGDVRSGTAPISLPARSVTTLLID